MVAIFKVFLQYLVQANRLNNIIIDGYVRLKEFAEIYYPDVEIISVNPVGLKGLFADIYMDGEECIYSKN